jgi:hypothetical protein
MHEIAMRSATNVHKSGQSNASVDLEDQPGVMDASQFADCLESVHSLFRVFTSLNMSVIRALPALYFIRIIHAAIVLVKLYFAAMRLPDANKRSARMQDLKVDEYLNRMLRMFTGWGDLWPADKLTKVIRKIFIWFEQNSDRAVIPNELAWLDSWAFKQSPLQQPGEPMQPPALDAPGQQGDYFGSVRIEKQHVEVQKGNISAGPNIFQSMPPGKLPAAHQAPQIAPLDSMLHDSKQQSIQSMDWFSTPAGAPGDQTLPSMAFDQTLPLGSMEMVLSTWLDANIGVGVIDNGGHANHFTDELEFGQPMDVVFDENGFPAR